MLRNLILFFLVLSLVFPGIAQETDKTDAFIKGGELPDFKDASLWKSRPALTRFSNDGKYLAVSAINGGITVYDTDSITVKSKIPNGSFSSFSFTPDSKLMVMAQQNDAGYVIYDVETGKLVRSIKGFEVLSKMGRSLGGSGIENSWQGANAGVYSVLPEVPVSRDWKTILINKNDKEFALYDFETGEKKFDFDHAKYSKGWEIAKLALVFAGIAAGVPANGLLGSSSNSAFSPDGKYVVIANGNKNPTIWNTETGELKIKYESDKRIFWVGFSPDSRFLAASDYSGVTNVIDVETGKELATFGDKKEKTRVIGWLDDSRIIVVNRIGTNIRVFRLGEEITSYKLEREPSFGPLISSDKKLAVVLPRKTKTIFARILNTDTGEEICSIPKGKSKRAAYAQFSPGGRYFLFANKQRDPIQVWSTDCKLVQVLEGSLLPVSFSSDGQMLATGGVGPTEKDDTGLLWRIGAADLKESIP